MTQSPTTMPDVIYLNMEETKDFDPCGLPVPDGVTAFVNADKLAKVRSIVAANQTSDDMRECLAILEGMGV